MKKILQTVALTATVLFATNASAQLPDNGIYPGGLVIDSYQPSAGYGGNHIYNMGSWDIDSILDSGTPVILDLFATWCGPCWSYHQAGTLEALYDSQGWGGPGNVAIFAVDSDPGTAPALLEGGDQGDWITNTKYPMANHDQVAGMMNLAYYPTIIMICPDRTVTEVGQTTEASFTASLQGCGGPATNSNDPQILSSSTASSISVCQSATADVSVSVVVQNFSTSAISGMYTIELRDASNTLVGSTNANLNLAPYAVQDVTIATVTANLGANVFTAMITTANDDVTNDSQSIGITVTGSATFEVTANMNIRIEMDIDGYASEVGFALVEGIPAGDAAAVYAAANAGNSVAYLATGNLSNGTSSYGQDFTIANLGCHYFVTRDTYGDGITYQNAAGEARLISTNSVSIPGGWDYGTLLSYDFIADGNGGGTDGIEENSIANLNVYPNPASDVANVSLTLTDASDVSISVVNTLGQTIFTQNLGNVNGEQNVQINTTDLEEGIYLVNISVNGTIITKRISVIK